MPPPPLPPKLPPSNPISESIGSSAPILPPLTVLLASRPSKPLPLTLPDPDQPRTSPSFTQSSFGSKRSFESYQDDEQLGPRGLHHGDYGHYVIDQGRSSIRPLPGLRFSEYSLGPINQVIEASGTSATSKPTATRRISSTSSTSPLSPTLYRVSSTGSAYPQPSSRYWRSPQDAADTATSIKDELDTNVIPHDHAYSTLSQPSASRTGPSTSVGNREHKPTGQTWERYNSDQIADSASDMRGSCGEPMKKKRLGGSGRNATSCDACSRRKERVSWSRLGGKTLMKRLQCDQRIPCSRCVERNVAADCSYHRVEETRETRETKQMKSRVRRTERGVWPVRDREASNRNGHVDGLIARAAGLDIDSQPTGRSCFARA